MRMSSTSTKPNWCLSTIIAKFKSKFHTKVVPSETITDEGIEETEPLIYEFEQEEEDGTNQTNTNETSDNDTDTTDENDAINTSKNNILGMICVGIGTGMFCTGDAIVSAHDGNVIEYLLGRVVVTNILSVFLWFVNPYQVKGDSINWYGDEPHRINVWTRGFLWFCSCWLIWCGIELIPIGLCYIEHMCSTLNWCNN